MAFGMSPFPLQFGSRGGGGDPTVLTPAILAALGFTYTRTGEVYGRRAPGGPGNYVRHATNDPELDFTEVDGKNYPSLIVRGAATPLVSYSADLTNAAWTKTDCSAELVTGSLESAAAPNGHSLVTATANNATVTRQLTRASANRNTRWKIKAPVTNIGDVKISQDGGSTSTTLTPGEFADIELGEQTSANPTIWLQLTNDGDTVEHYDVQMAELAAGTPVPNFVPQGATPVATGAALLERTLLAPPDEVDVSVLFQAPATLTGERYLFEVSKDASNRASVAFLADDVRFQNHVTANELVSVGSVSASDVAMVDAQISASLSRSRLDLGDWKSTATARIPSDISRLTIGSYLSGLFPFGGGIVSVRDNNGQLLQQIESYGPELADHPWTEGDSIAGWTLAAGASYAVAGGYVRVWRTSSTSERLYKTLDDLELGEFYDIWVERDVGTRTTDIRFSPNLDFVSGVMYFPVVAGSNHFRARATATTMYLGIQILSTSDPGHSGFGAIRFKKVNFKQSVGFGLGAIGRHEASL